MPLEILFVMDEPERLDTTLTLADEALARGHRALICHAGDLGLDGPEPVAYARPLRSVAPLALGDDERIKLRECDAVLMRTDPPVDGAYLTATLVLERARGGPLLLNDPRALREINEKLAVLDFPSLAPPTCVARRPEELVAFMDRCGGAMVVKPLDGCGGRGIFVARSDDPNLASILEAVTDAGSRAVVAQRYLPAAGRGDKRILLLDGEPIGAVLRVPAAGAARANLSAGARAEATELTPREREICRAIGPWCRANGLILVGIDVIGGRLTEVNVTSPGGLRTIDAVAGTHLAATILDWLEARCTPLAVAA